MFRLELEPKLRYDSMMKGLTFSPPNDDPRFIFSEALRNMGAAFAKLRRHKHLAKEVGLCLRLKDYTGHGATATLPMLTAHDCEAVLIVRQIFDGLFTPGQVYRSTMVWLGGLVPEHQHQPDMFEETPVRHDYGKLDEAMDRINRRYGQNAVAPSALMDGRLKPRHSRDAAPERYDVLLHGEGDRHLAILRMTLGTPV